VVDGGDVLESVLYEGFSVLNCSCSSANVLLITEWEQMCIDERGGYGFVSELRFDQEQVLSSTV